MTLRPVIGPKLPSTADQAGRSNAMHVLAVAAQMAGDFLEVRELMNRRIALARKTGNFAVVSIEANNLSMLERQLRNIDEAEPGRPTNWYTMDGP